MFQNKIREIRKSLNISQEELANSIGVNRATISKYESGAITPTLEIIFAIAATFGVSVDDLFPELKGLRVDTPEELKKSAQAAIADVQKAAMEAANTLPDIEEMIDSGRLLMHHFEKLNRKGREEATKSVQIIAGNPQYQKGASED